MSDTRYRQLLFLYVALVVAAVAAMFVPGGYSAELADAFANEPDAWLMRSFWLQLAILAPLLVAWIFGLVGLFFFKWWGRTLSTYSTIAGLLVYPFMSPSLSSGLESTLFEAHTLLWGALLALAYFSPVSVRFGR